jgi:hypothetical protein
VKTLETLWMENGTPQSPADAVSPRQVTIFQLHCLRGIVTVKNGRKSESGQ